MIKEKPLLTAVVLTFNNEDTIARCLDSLVNQKTNYPYEIRVYDDCSLDKNAEICRAYAEKYPDKIKLTLQPENTFLKPYDQTQAYQAFQEIDTKYFCIIEGDDYWCNENKIQIALDFLENNPEYVGWAHDTLQVDENDGSRLSWVHEAAKYKIENPVRFDDKFIFLMTCSRIFRTLDFKKLKIWPVDYLIYNYHLSKGLLHYHDEIMAVYTIGPNGTFTTLGNRRIADMNGMFSYKISKILDFEFDDLCTEMQKHYDTSWGLGERSYKTLKFLKKIFGVKTGWKIWFFQRFVFKYGLESMDANYVYPRKKIKKNSDKKFGQASEQISFEKQKKELAEIYEKYCADKKNYSMKNEFFDLLKATVTQLCDNRCFDKINELCTLYAEAYPIFANIFFPKHCRLLKRCAKYRKQRTYCLLAILTLIVLNIATFFYFWS